MTDYETHIVDVLIIGAGGAGLRAAAEASAMGATTAVVCKSLLGKAHTVMAEGGVAAALGNVWPEDNWKVHFRDTMRGGKMLNNWRMAQLHAQESPERVLELEQWGALFDRTPDGLILQRDFGGHRYARLAHVGDRTGLELLRTVQHRAVAVGIQVFMECIQFHPTGMIWPPSARGLLVTEGVRGDGGILKNRDNERFMFNYISDYFKAETSDTIEEADNWYDNKRDFRRPPELLPRDEVARAINSEVKAGRGSPHGGVFLDIASRRSAEDIKRRLPSMYHQFKELADVDITKDAMEIGPTCHYIMGGIRVDADSAAATVPGLFAAGEVAGGMHGANRLGGNSLSDLLVFGRRAGIGAADFALGMSGAVVIDETQVEAITQHALAFFDHEGHENAYSAHQALQNTMQELVGIIRTEPELLKAKDQLGELESRARDVSVEGHRQFNPGWHLALDLEAMVAVAQCTTLGAIERRESRGGHTREDFPLPDNETFGKINMVTSIANEEVSVRSEPLSEMPPELRELFEEAH